MLLDMEAQMKVTDTPFSTDRARAQATADYINHLFAKRGHTQPVVEVVTRESRDVTLYCVVEINVELP